jgi:mono/diheme cytochrome c family protein
MATQSRSVVVMLVSAICATAAVACDDTPSDLRQWRPADHQHQVETGQPPPAADDQVQSPSQSGRPSGTMPDLSASGITPVAMTTWSKQCARCHGQVGRGDGPMGSTLRMPDFAKPETLANATPASVAATIRQGRGSMPAFDLPDATISGLANLVLMMGGHSPNSGTAPPSPEASGAGQPASASEQPAPLGTANQQKL